jgi:transcriptional antiterminator NusG
VFFGFFVPFSKKLLFLIRQAALSGHENKVREKMVCQLEISDDLPIYEVLIPTTEGVEVRHGNRKTTTRKRFPGYILLRMDLYDENYQVDERVWYFVRSIQGVLGFLGGANHPEPLSPEEVSSIIIAPAPPKVEFSAGQHVRITDGPFSNSEGVIQTVDCERCRVLVLVSIFNRSTPVELEFWQVEAL